MVPLHVYIPIGRTKIALRTLKGIVESFGHLEKRLIASKHQPGGVHTDVAVQRNKRSENLSHTTTIGRGVDMGNPGTLKVGGKDVDLLQQTFFY